MASSTTSEAQMKQEIARLTASINQHKSKPTPAYAGRNNSYVNPNYKPPSNKYIRPSTSGPPPSRPPPIASSSQVTEVVLGGVAFKSSGRSLVRKDLPVPPPILKPISSRPVKPTSRPIRPPADYSRRGGHLIPSNRVYKSKSSRGSRGGNMTLTNNKRPYQSRKISKKLDKPCPRFTTTGACSRGLTCLYQHDPAKIAICWNFLQDKCPNTASTCNLSHEPTPERTPLCLHFVNKGRCTRENCPYPHVNVGVRQGVCRDFAVLGYCEKGLDCDKQHVRECPDFAEKGTCSTKGCKLPHVIRANRNRKAEVKTDVSVSLPPVTNVSTDPNPQHVSAESAQLGDEFISLTFMESESESESEEEDEESGDEESEEGEEEKQDSIIDN